jgi:DNA-binding IclR family transcriptional regulator
MADKELTAEERRAKYSVPALEKALDMIEYLCDAAVPLTQTQLARALGRQPGELFRMLTCLETRGYLRRDPVNGAYELTLKLFELSRTHSPYEELLRAAVPPMRALADRATESCHLSIVYRNRLLVIAQEESPSPFRLSIEVGSSHPLVNSTSGRLLLAHMAMAERDSLLAADADFAALTPSARKGFIDRLAMIRERGYETAESEFFIGTLDIGVLIGAQKSRIQAALTISLLKRKNSPDVEGLRQLLAECAESINVHAGLHAPGKKP